VRSVDLRNAPPLFNGESCRKVNMPVSKSTAS
jgi:hypothetical protein